MPAARVCSSLLLRPSLSLPLALSPSSLHSLFPLSLPSLSLSLSFPLSLSPHHSLPLSLSLPLLLSPPLSLSFSVREKTLNS